ncbi:dienelactone hydrolase family protein [Candidatus Microgenomates bacterium]|nr:dienelactone hydrolase family protein [Candidatus Microgenomates bacterium]
MVATRTINQLVKVPIDAAHLLGNLVIPSPAKALIIFAHGSGSSRLSPRNKFVAKVLQQANLATLLTDLLTETEDQDYQQRFDIELLTKRLVAVTNWVDQDPTAKDLELGYFGASTGAAAALKAAAQLRHIIKAVVSRGGRPDLAVDVLAKLEVPTLLIVGGNDHGVIELNQTALKQLAGPKRLSIVPGATHLFEEPGTLEQVAELAATWFRKHLKT